MKGQLERESMCKVRITNGRVQIQSEADEKNNRLLSPRFVIRGMGRHCCTCMDRFIDRHDGCLDNRIGDCWRSGFFLSLIFLGKDFLMHVKAFVAKLIKRD